MDATTRHWRRPKRAQRKAKLRQQGVTVRTFETWINGFVDQQGRSLRPEDECEGNA